MFPLGFVHQYTIVAGAPELRESIGSADHVEHNVSVGRGRVGRGGQAREDQHLGRILLVRAEDCHSRPIVVDAELVIASRQRFGAGLEGKGNIPFDIDVIAQRIGNRQQCE